TAPGDVAERDPGAAREDREHPDGREPGGGGARRRAGRARGHTHHPDGGAAAMTFDISDNTTSGNPADSGTEANIPDPGVGPESTVPPTESEAGGADV